MYQDDEYSDSDWSMRKGFYEKSIEHSNIDRFLEYWWTEFTCSLIDYGIRQEIVDSLDPENFRHYYDSGYSPYEISIIEDCLL